jgi:hypothetical protein
LTPAQSAALDAIARREPLRPWPGLAAQQVEALQRKAAECLLNYQRYHQPHGLTADILFDSRERRRVEKLEGIGDAATWTGHYLAALGFRYDATRSKEVLLELGKVLDSLEVLTHVSGKAGFLARFAGPADDAAFEHYYSVYGAGANPARPGLGTWAFRGAGAYSNMVWLSYTSRDVYIAVNLGLATAWRLVPDGPQRARLKVLVELILDRLIQDGWAITDPEGHESRWRSTPSMAVALLRTGASVNPGRYLKLYQEKARLALEAPAPTLCGRCDYFPNNLEFAIHHVLAALETEPAWRSNYQEKLRQMWAQVSDHLNAWFAVLYVSATGDLENERAVATLQGALLDYPSIPRWDRAVDQGRRPGLATVTEEGKTWSRYALPVRERVPTDFLWQRSPFQLQGGGNGPLEYPGLDFLLAYWAACAHRLLKPAH